MKRGRGVLVAVLSSLTLAFQVVEAPLPAAAGQTIPPANAIYAIGGSGALGALDSVVAEKCDKLDVITAKTMVLRIEDKIE